MQVERAAWHSLPAYEAVALDVLASALGLSLALCCLLCCLRCLGAQLWRALTWARRSIVDGVRTVPKPHARVAR